MLLDVAKEICPAFQVDDDNRMLLNDIFNWCMMLQGKYNPHKGLLLHGDIGTGKSTMLEIVKRFCAIVRPKENGYSYSFRITTAINIAAEFNSHGYDGIRTYVDTKHQAFDDLGCEPRKVIYYGTMVNVMEHVILGRYGRFDDFTHLTTNLTMDEIKSEYGPRVYDRCKEMFNVVEMNGKTRRKID